MLDSFLHYSHILIEQVLIATRLLIEIRQVGLHVLEAASLAKHAMAFVEELLTVHGAVLACRHIVVLKLALAAMGEITSTTLGLL